MKIKSTSIDGLLIIEPNVYLDDRGFFLETYQKERYVNCGILDSFTQDNQSRSEFGVIRGMHYQIKNPQAKLVTVLRGRVLDVVIDLRIDSKTFGAWCGIELSDETRDRQLYVPVGLAHGFCVLSDTVDMHYKVTGKYDPSDEGGVNCMDPDLDISWPIEAPIISSRDRNFPLLKNINKEDLPQIDL